MSLTIDINGYCNLDCDFCYQDLDGSTLPKDKLMRVVDENSHLDVVELGGGEPFLDVRINDLVKTLREKGKLIHISTNGSRIPPGFLELDDAVREGTQVQVSLHASNPELYRQITGKDLFHRVVENIGRLKERYTTVVSTAVYQKNVVDVPHIVELVYRMGVPLRVNPVFPEGKGKEVELLTPQQIGQLTGYLLAQHLAKRRMVDSPLIHPNVCGALEQSYGLPKRGPCPIEAGTKLYISPRGERFNCEFMR